MTSRISLSNLDKNIGFLIRKLRKSNNMSGSALGGLIGVSQQQISRYELGVSELKIKQLYKIVDIFGVSIWEFMDMLFDLFFTEHDIITVLKSVEAGRTVKEVCRNAGISESRYYSWKLKYSNM